MPGRTALLSRYRKQTAVYWANPSPDGHGGRTIGIDAVQILVRWEQKAELYIDANGEERRSSAVVLVGENMTVGDFLYLGALTDLAADQKLNPLIVAGAYEVRAWKKVPDAKALRFSRKVWL